MAELVVRMGELAASGAAHDVLVALGLGSCIGLAVVDRTRGLAGLAHIVLPVSSAAGGAPATFADTGVLALLDELQRLGARHLRLEAVLVGGDQMLGRSSRREVGARNEGAVREQLGWAGVRVVAAKTRGAKGRSVRVHVGAGTVIVKVAGERPAPVWGEER